MSTNIKSSDLTGNLQSLIGADGKSAYELAVMKGYTGTLEEWLASLKGDKGDKGDNYIITEADITEIGNIVTSEICSVLTLLHKGGI